MNWPSHLRRPAPIAPPTLADSARALAEFRCLCQRERIKARARLMRQEMGMEPSVHLQSKVTR